MSQSDSEHEWLMSNDPSYRQRWEEHPEREAYQAMGPEDLRKLQRNQVRLAYLAMSPEQQAALQERHLARLKTMAPTREAETP